MSMTREDMLRELELLPVWQLRQPLPKTPDIAPAIVSVIANEATILPIETTLDTPEIAAAPVIKTAPETQTVKVDLPLRAMVSEDGAYVFLLALAPALVNAEAEQLLQNMLRAMRVSCRVEMQDTVARIFNLHPPKLIICMGEQPANQLLQQSLSLQQWRSQQQQQHAMFQEIPVIITYEPQHLLAHLQDKALAWKDLCLAMQIMQGL